jgi:hypothetical protein
MYDCGGNGYNNYYNKYANNNDDNSYKAMYNWYTYELDQDNALDMSEVCTAVKKANGELHTFYNGNNGHMYSYGSGSSSGSVEDFLDGTENESVSNYKKQSYDAGLSGGAIFGIVAAFGVVIGALAAVIIKVQSRLSDKDEPLMGEETEGEMA